jgi:uncharacterized protein (TIGR04255 family)
LRPPDLPDFNDPPVIEVVLGVQFARIAGFSTVHVGRLHERFRKDFPQVQEAAPLDPVFEIFGATANPQTSIRIQLTAEPILPRMWFINADNTQLIQFQPDRILHNWRKTGEGDAYPRYESIKERLFENLEVLDRFLHDEGLGDLKPNQVEISYINHILFLKDENLHSQPGVAMRNWLDVDLPGGFGAPEDVRFMVRYVITRGAAPAGRLTVTAEPRALNDGRPVLQLTLIARGAPTSESLESVSEFLDLGRDHIVRQFAAMTTPAMHQRWRRKV